MGCSFNVVKKVYVYTIQLNDETPIAVEWQYNDVVPSISVCGSATTSNFSYLF